MFDFVASSIPSLPSSFEPHRVNISSILVRIRDLLDAIATEFIRTASSQYFERSNLCQLDPIPSNSFGPIFRVHLFEFAASSIPSLPSSFASSQYFEHICSNSGPVLFHRYRVDSHRANISNILVRIRDPFDPISVSIEFIRTVSRQRFGMIMS